MNHSNMYAVGLALCTFANIAGEEMSRDLVNEIEKLLGSSNTYIRKKVCFESRVVPLGLTLPFFDRRLYAHFESSVESQNSSTISSARRKVYFKIGITESCWLE